MSVNTRLTEEFAVNAAPVGDVHCVQKKRLKYFRPGLPGRLLIMLTENDNSLQFKNQGGRINDWDSLPPAEKKTLIRELVLSSEWCCLPAAVKQRWLDQYDECE